MSQKRIIHAKDTSSSHLNQYRDLELDNGSLKVKGNFDSDINDSLNNIETEIQSVDNRLTTGVRAIGNTAGDGSGTDKSLVVDTNGHLQVDIVNTANVKFEDISSSLNSGTNNDPPNSLACGLRGRTTITDKTTETFLKCDTAGCLEVKSEKTTGEWLATGTTIADDNYSPSALDCRRFREVRIFGKAGSSLSNLPILGSQTESGTYYNLPSTEILQQAQVEIGGTTEYHMGINIVNPPPYLHLYNQSGGSITMELDYVGITN